MSSLTETELEGLMLELWDTSEIPLVPIAPIVSINQLMMRWRYRPALKRRTRPIGEHQNNFGRFLLLRQPFGMLKAEVVRRAGVRPWPAWRCRLEWRIDGRWG